MVDKFLSENFTEDEILVLEKGIISFDEPNFCGFCNPICSPIVGGGC